MPHKHVEPVPTALEQVVHAIGGLESALGPQVASVLAGIRLTLIAAMAARDRGDVPGAIHEIGKAMDRLAALADQLDPTEATLMRALAQNFRGALLRGDEAQAKQNVAVMFRKSGAAERKKS